MRSGIKFLTCSQSVSHYQVLLSLGFADLILLNYLIGSEFVPVLNYILLKFATTKAMEDPITNILHVTFRTERGNLMMARIDDGGVNLTAEEMLEKVRDAGPDWARSHAKSIYSYRRLRKSEL